jgi:hypothetical protein
MRAVETRPAPSLKRVKDMHLPAARRPTWVPFPEKGKQASKGDAKHSPCYTGRMLKRSLTRTNPYLLDPAKRRAMFQMTVSTSTDIEGVKLTPSDLLAETRTRRRITSRESAKSSRSPR